MRFTAEVPLRTKHPPPRGRGYIRRCGGLLPAGTRLTTAELPVLSLGIADVRRLWPQVRVALLPTGDELQLPASRWRRDKFMTLTV